MFFLYLLFIFQPHFFARYVPPLVDRRRASKRLLKRFPVILFSLFCCSSSDIILFIYWIYFIYLLDLFFCISLFQYCLDIYRVFFIIHIKECVCLIGLSLYYFCAFARDSSEKKKK
eukprot:135573_1